MTPSEVLLNRIQEMKMKQVYDRRRPGYSPQPERTRSTLNIAGGPMGELTYDNPILAYLTQQQEAVASRLQSAQADVYNQTSILDTLVNRINNGQVANESARTLENNLGVGLTSALVPGNVGDINRIIWPFWFTSTQTVLIPGQVGQGNITVTQEAAFIWMAYTKAVFEETAVPNNFLYVDPSQPGAAGKSNGLTMLMRDSSSSRQFMNRPVDINNIGYWMNPTVLPTPQLFLPNSNLELTFENNTVATKYKVYITMFGYRLRIENAQDLLGVVTG